MSKVIAIIPAKSHSRRLEGKNMLPFAGKPLLSYTIEAALDSQLLDEVYVSTDCQKIADFSISRGAKVPFLRPQDQCLPEVHSSVPIIDMVKRLGGLEFASYCLNLLPTHPIRKRGSIDKVIDLARSQPQSVVSLERPGLTDRHIKVLENGRVHSLMGSPDVNFQSGDTREIYVLRAAIQCCSVNHLLKHQSFQSSHPIGFELDRFESLDIDTREDFQYIERVFLSLHSGHPYIPSEESPLQTNPKDKMDRVSV